MNRSEQFDQLIAEFLDAQRRNQAPSRGQMLARHPETAKQLKTGNEYRLSQTLSQQLLEELVATLPTLPEIANPPSNLGNEFDLYPSLNEKGPRKFIAWATCAPGMF